MQYGQKFSTRLRREGSCQVHRRYESIHQVRQKRVLRPSLCYYSRRLDRSLAAPFSKKSKYHKWHARFKPGQLATFSDSIIKWCQLPHFSSRNIRHLITWIASKGEGLSLLEQGARAILLAFKSSIFGIKRSVYILYCSFASCQTRGVCTGTAYLNPSLRYFVLRRSDG